MKGKINGVFSERLKLLRASRKMSQAQFAKKLNMAQSSIANWEVCKSEPTCEKLAETADVFGVSLDYLLGRTENPLSVVSANTPYEEVTPFEKEILTRYRKMSEAEQVMVCRMLGLVHPAESRIKAKRAQ